MDMYETAATLLWDPKLHLIDRVTKILDIAQMKLLIPIALQAQSLSDLGYTRI